MQSFFVKSPTMPQEPPFQLWSAAEKKILDELPLDAYHKEMLTNLMTLMNESVHTNRHGWYQRLNATLTARLEEKTADTAAIQTIQQGLNRYLEVANKLQKSKKGALEARKLPTRDVYIEHFARVYDAFWETCRYTVIYNALVKMSRMTPDELNANNKGKKHAYALIRLKEQEIPHLKLSDDLKQKLVTGIDTVITGMLAKCNIHDRFLLAEKDVIAALDVAFSIIPHYLLMVDLQREFEKDYAYARYVHVRPTLLAQMAQIIDYVYQLYADSGKEQRTLFKKTPSINKDDAQTVMAVLDVKRKEIAAVMGFQEFLALHYGTDDIIEVIHNLVGNESTLLLPGKTFFAFEREQNVQLGEFEKMDKDAPSPIPRRELSAWRRNYTALHGEEKTVTHTELTESNHYFSTQHDLRQFLQTQKSSDLVSSEMVRIVAITRQGTKFRFAIQCLDVFPGMGDEIAANPCDFFITTAHDRQTLTSLNATISKRVLRLMFQQIDHALDYDSLFSAATRKLLPGTEGAANNFKSLMVLLHCLGQPCEEELRLAGLAMQQTRNPGHRTILKKYIELLTYARATLLLQAKSIVSYWQDKVNNIAADAYCDVGELTDILTASAGLIERPRFGK